MIAGVNKNLPDRPPIHFRWLGAAGIELTCGDEGLAEESLLIDPFFTRPPSWRLLFGRVAANPGRIPASLLRCDHILVSHAHYDHLLDVPAIARRTLAQVYGSANTCALLRVCAVPNEQIHTIHAGDVLTLGSFRVDVLAARHGWSPGYSSGQVRTDLQPPLRLHDYVLGEYNSFLIQLPGLRLLDWGGVETQGAPKADVLFMLPTSLPGFYETLLAAVQPRLVVPVHWDDLFRPLSKPIRPGFELPRWELPPLKRIDLARFKETVRRIAPGAQVLIPEVLETYDLSGAVNHE
jgi:L-ascorbate metabolism protein UlaG (beta-lactamase superfamily)